MNQFNSMGANIINLIITFTIVTTALSAIEKFTDFKFLTLFVVCLVFLGVSSVIVTSFSLGRKKEIHKMVVIIWGILLIIFIATLLGTIFSII